MRNTGLNIVRKVSRFLKDIYVNPKKTDVGDIVSLDNKNKVSRSAYVRTTKNRLLVGNRSTEEFNIQRERTTAGVGVDLGIKAGDGFGTDKVGGDLNMYGGASTGQANGGSIRFFQAARAGSTGSSLNSYTELFNTELTQSRINFIGLKTLLFVDDSAKIHADEFIELMCDHDNDATDAYIALRSYTATLALFPDQGGLYLSDMDASGNHVGLHLDAPNSLISAGSRAIFSGVELDTDTTGGLNTAGVDLVLAGGAGTGSGAAGGISFGSYAAGGSGLSANSTFGELMKLDNAGNLQIDGGLTTGSTSFVNSSGVVQVATQGTIDHDSLANFVAAEHYRWDNDISGTATIHANNVPSVATTHATAQTGKNYRIINTSFRQDIGTTKYYLPFKSQDENVTVHREEVSELAVCDGRVVSVTLRVENLNTHSGDARVTFGVETNRAGVTYATWAVNETETLAIDDGDDQHLFHYVFSDAKHWDSTDMFAISIQSDTDMSGANERFFVTVVIEDDWNTYLAGSSREIESTP